jgi:hypothetical protein
VPLTFKAPESQADAAGRVLAVALDGAELGGELCLLGNVGGVAQHDNAAVPDQSSRAAKAS